MKNIKIVCDFREDFNNFSDSNIVFNVNVKSCAYP